MPGKIVPLLAIPLAVACRGDSAPPRADTVEDRTAETAVAPSADARPVVLFLGTSLTAGHGLELEQAYPALIQQRIDSAGLPFRVVNAGVSGMTSAGGLDRIDWLLREPVAVLVLELGANDALRGLDPEAMRRNLQEIIDRTRQAHSDAKIVIEGMEAPPNLGERYTDAFRAVYPELARRNDATLVPFLLEGVAAVPALNQSDGIHPTAEGQRRIAETVWRSLEPVLQSAAAERRAASRDST